MVKNCGRPLCQTGLHVHPPFFIRKPFATLFAVKIQSIQMALLKPIQIKASKGLGLAMRTYRFFVFVEAGNAEESLALSAFFQLVPQLQTNATLEVIMGYPLSRVEASFVDEAIKLSFPGLLLLVLNFSKDIFFVKYGQLFVSQH